MSYVKEKITKSKRDGGLRENTIQRAKESVLIALLFLSLVYLFQLYPPEAKDWRLVFYPVARNPLHPYEARLFINPPWLSLLLLPFGFFSEMTSLAINATLSMLMMAFLVIRRGGSRTALILTLTSLPVLSTLANGSVEWIIVIAFIVQNKWSVPLLLLKPQVGILAVLGWDSFWQKKALFVLWGGLISALSFLIWGNWIPQLLGNLQYIQNALNDN